MVDAIQLDDDDDDDEKVQEGEQYQALTDFKYFHRFAKYVDIFQYMIYYVSI